VDFGISNLQSAILNPKSAIPSVGKGRMRLSTESDRDDARALAVLHAALDAGATLLDTADAYCRDEREKGHNERLVAADQRRGRTGERRRVDAFEVRKAART
jgi:aryl-alcohol dehydrogenase-like predicted oxidoreductase